MKTGNKLGGPPKGHTGYIQQKEEGQALSGRDTRKNQGLPNGPRREVGSLSVLETPV